MFELGKIVIEERCAHVESIERVGMKYRTSLTVLIGGTPLALVSVSAPYSAPYPPQNTLHYHVIPTAIPDYSTAVLVDMVQGNTIRVRANVYHQSNPLRNKQYIGSAVHTIQLDRKRT